MVLSGGYFIGLFHDDEGEVMEVMRKATKEGYDILRVRVPLKIILMRS